MLELQNISYSVRENGVEKNILKNISLIINDHQNVVITGQNGSGKSTLAKIIMGIIQPTSGKIIFNGEDITHLSVTERARKGIAFGFQQPVTFKGLKVRDLLEIILPQNTNCHECCTYLAKVGLCAKDYLERPLDNKLSGGELKRIEIATVLARQAKLNIFDEPEAGIDLWSFDNLVDIFQQQQATNIIISHQHKIIAIADTVVLLNSAKIDKVGTPDEVIKFINTTKQCAKLGGTH
ncbi:MAG: ATP-binding cassette domain-containing protein [Eubacteriales bacterium]|nr:ATP-binding cassette domain-containing protein [Eubacteriales bacterium]